MLLTSRWTRPFQILSFALLWLLSTAAISKSFNSLEKVDQASELFMSQIFKGEVENAYALMSAYAGVDMNAFLERGEKAAQSLEKLESATGKAFTYAKIKTQAVEGHFYKITYLLKYASAALVWELNYYQPQDGWLLVDVSFNAEIDKLFE